MVIVVRLLVCICVATVVAKIQCTFRIPFTEFVKYAVNDILAKHNRMVGIIDRDVGRADP